MDRLGLCVAFYACLIFLVFFASYEYRVGPYAMVLTVTWVVMVLIIMLCREISKRCDGYDPDFEPKTLRIVVHHPKDLGIEYKRGVITYQNAQKENIQGNDGRNTETQETG